MAVRTPARDRPLLSLPRPSTAESLSGGGGDLLRVRVPRVRVSAALHRALREPACAFHRACPTLHPPNKARVSYGTRVQTHSRRPSPPSCRSNISQQRLQAARPATDSWFLLLSGRENLSAHNARGRRSWETRNATDALFLDEDPESPPALLAAAPRNASAPSSPPSCWRFFFEGGRRADSREGGRADVLIEPMWLEAPSGLGARGRGGASTRSDASKRHVWPTTRPGVQKTPPRPGTQPLRWGSHFSHVFPKASGAMTRSDVTGPGLAATIRNGLRPARRQPPPPSISPRDSHDRVREPRPPSHTKPPPFPPDLSR